MLALIADRHNLKDANGRFNFNNTWKTNSRLAAIKHRIANQVANIAAMTGIKRLTVNLFDNVRTGR